MLLGATNPTTQSPSVASRGAIPEMLRTFSQLFEVTRPDARDRIGHLWWLAAFVLAGAVLRFWGLGAVGLHGDEETMAMAVSHILIDGRSTLPSGMLYPRGVTQLYLMALSTSIFGESEWALRLPSAICGVALIVLAYVLGRRFLRPNWNLAFAATAAFLPTLILYSQTARMYIFMITFIVASMICLTAWERTGRSGWLVAAVIALLFGLDMHALTLAAAPMLLMPGIIQGDLRKLIPGVIAVGAVILGFVLIDGWVSAQYPVPPPEFAADLSVSPAQHGSQVPRDFSLAIDIALWAAGMTVALLATFVARAVAGPGRVASICVALLLLAGIGLQLAVYYHLAGLMYVAGVVLALRYRSRLLGARLVVLVSAIGVIALVHVILLANRADTVVRLVGALVGQPSAWPYVRIAELSPAASLLTGALLAWGLYALANRRPVTDYWLLAVLGVWAPVFAVGAFAWNVPARYTTMSLAPMLLCAFAFAQRGADWLFARWSSGRHGARLDASAAALVGLLAINPASTAAVVNSDYRIHPDHQGAAEFMRTQGVNEGDIVLAEDVLQQTYYLGKVDYWLIGPQVARRFIKRSGEGVVDFYTGTPVIATGAMLDKVLQENSGKRVFLIGSGEGWRKGRRNVRGDELHARVNSGRFEVIYTGRDNLTRVMRAVSGAVSPSAATKAEAIEDVAELVEDASASEEQVRSQKGLRPQAAPIRRE